MLNLFFYLFSLLSFLCLAYFLATGYLSFTSVKRNRRRNR